MIRCRIPVIASESPDWPVGGAAIARHGGFFCALLKPDLTEPERDDAIAWVNQQIDAARAGMNEPARVEVYP